MRKAHAARGYYGEAPGQYMYEVEQKLRRRPPSHVVGDDCEPHELYDGRDDPPTLPEYDERY